MSGAVVATMVGVLQTMLHADPRAYRVALVADAIANEAVAPFDAWSMLLAAQYGVVVLPPSDFELATIESTVEYAVDDLADYRRNGYRVIVVGDSSLADDGVWASLIAAEVTRRSIESFEQIDLAGCTEAEFASFLAIAPAAARH